MDYEEKFDALAKQIAEIADDLCGLQASMDPSALLYMINTECNNLRIDSGRIAGERDQYLNIVESVAGEDCKCPGDPLFTSLRQGRCLSCWARGTLVDTRPRNNGGG